jgi:hypothetical protein
MRTIYGLLSLLFLCFACQQSTIEDLRPELPSNEGFLVLELPAHIHPLQETFIIGDTVTFSVPFPEPAINDSVYFENTIVDFSLSLEMHQNNSGRPFSGSAFEFILEEGDFDSSNQFNERTDIRFHSTCKNYPDDFIRFKVVFLQEGIYSLGLRPDVFFNNIPDPCDNSNFANAGQRGSIVFVYSPFAIHENVLSQLTMEEYDALNSAYFEQLNEGMRLFVKVEE